MSAPLVRTSTLTALLLAVAVAPPEAAAQRAASIYVPSVRALGLAEVCRTRALIRDPVLDRISRVLSSSRSPGRDDGGERDAGAAEAELRALESEARRAAELAPADVGAAYRLAAVLGARTELAGGKDQLALAEELYPQALR
ncbi:MAG TPA: hypothetical protein VLL48_02615, partial [Longimicrobiales bacterium]|nr:hypothetical protein [Longimicrobiales bacterium]